eukprot:246856-Pelagomonas_calceolata.AAC.2
MPAKLPCKTAYQVALVCRGWLLASSDSWEVDQNTPPWSARLSTCSLDRLIHLHLWNGNLKLTCEGSGSAIENGS